MKKVKIKMESFDWGKKNWVVEQEFFKGCEDFIDVVDLDSWVWKNAEDTVVFVLTRSIVSLEEMCCFVSLFGARPDEVGTKIVEGKLVIRMRWD